MKRNHRELRVWQRAILLVEDIYKLTGAFPKEEQFGITSQMCRASVSVPCNIEEGAARKSTKELLYFLNIASGSLSELDTHLIISQRLGYIDDIIQLQEKIDNIAGSLMGLSSSLKRKGML